MNDQEEIAALRAQVSELTKRVAGIMDQLPLIDRRLTGLHKAFMAVSGEVIDINEKLKPLLFRAYPDLARDVIEINNIIRPRDDDDPDDPSNS